MGLGSYPAVTLARARQKALKARDLVAQEIDPITEADERAKKRSAQISFADYVEKFLPWINQNFSNPKHIAQWGMSLRSYAAPWHRSHSTKLAVKTSWLCWSRCGKPNMSPPRAYAGA